jgi:hypothetical protein
VFVVLRPLEVDRYHVPAARITPGHLHVSALQRAPVTRFLVVVQEYLYL